MEQHAQTKKNAQTREHDQYEMVAIYRERIRCHVFSAYTHVTDVSNEIPTALHMFLGVGQHDYAKENYVRIKSAWEIQDGGH